MNVHVYTTMFSTLWLQKNVAYALDIILLLLFNSASTIVCVCLCVCVCVCGAELPMEILFKKQNP